MFIVTYIDSGSMRVGQNVVLAMARLLLHIVFDNLLQCTRVTLCSVFMCACLYPCIQACIYIFSLTHKPLLYSGPCIYNHHRVCMSLTVKPAETHVDCGSLAYVFL